jgi:hypothetical protein
MLGVLAFVAAAKRLSMEETGSDLVTFKTALLTQSGCYLVQMFRSVR